MTISGSNALRHSGPQVLTAESGKQTLEGSGLLRRTVSLQQRFCLCLCLSLLFNGCALCLAFADMKLLCLQENPFALLDGWPRVLSLLYLQAYYGECNSFHFSAFRCASTLAVRVCCLPLQTPQLLLWSPAWPFLSVSVAVAGMLLVFPYELCCEYSYNCIPVCAKQKLFGALAGDSAQGVACLCDSTCPNLAGYRVARRPPVSAQQCCLPLPASACCFASTVPIAWCFSAGGALTSAVGITGTSAPSASGLRSPSPPPGLSDDTAGPGQPWAMLRAHAGQSGR